MSDKGPSWSSCFIFRMDRPIPDDKLRSISSIVSRQLCICYEIGSGYTSCYRNYCIIQDCLKSQKMKAKIITGGSSAERTITRTSDWDEMVEVPYILVAQNREEITRDYTKSVFIQDESHSNPGYTRLKLLRKTLQDYGEILEATSDGIFLSSEKYVKCVLKRRLPDSDTFRRHGPCITGAVYVSSGQKLDSDCAYGLFCKSWPDKKQEFFNRKQLHGWPSEKLMNYIRKADCHVVPVGDPTSKNSSLEWRFSFLLAERELIWSFNDTQIQCYFIFKALIKEYINPTVPDDVGLSSYIVKTIIFWQSENLEISAWREDQLLHRVQDCLSYLSQCVLCGRLEHFFYRRNNLLKHKLKKSDDRNFVLDTIDCILHNLAKYVFEILHQHDLLDIYGTCGKDDMEQLFRFLQNATQRDYDHLKNVLKKYFEFIKITFFVLLWVTVFLEDAVSLKQARKTLIERPPAHVDTKYIEKFLLGIDIRLAIQNYRATLDNSLIEEARKNIKGESLCFMENGANIDNVVGKLYLATLHYSLKNYSQCETLLLQVVNKGKEFLYAECSETSQLIEACEPDLKCIRKDIPFLVEIMLKTTIPLVFSREDVDFVPYPLKLECSIVTQDLINFFNVIPEVYAWTLLFMVQLSKKDTRQAKRFLDILAGAVYRHSRWFESYRSYNLLGYCYLLDGQRHRAISCFMHSLTRTRKLPIGNKNAALYHLAILCFDIYTETRSD